MTYVASGTAVGTSCDSFHFTVNLLLICVSVGLSGQFAVVVDLICAV